MTPVPWETISRENLAAMSNTGTVNRAWRELQESKVTCEMILKDKQLECGWSDGFKTILLLDLPLEQSTCSCRSGAVCRHIVRSVLRYQQGGATYAGLAVPGLHGSKSSGSDEEIPAALTELFIHLLKSGGAYLNDSFTQELLSLKTKLTRSDYIYPLERLTDLVDSLERYKLRDARFSPADLVSAASELIVRCDALASPASDQEKIEIQGERLHARSHYSSDRFVGIGTTCGESGTELAISAFVYDCMNHRVIEEYRRFSRTIETETSYSDLGEIRVAGSTSFAELGEREVVLDSKAAAVDLRLALGRQSTRVKKQGFQWESIMAPPVLRWDFEDLKEEILELRPSVLRRLNSLESFHVCAIHSASEPHFLSSSQEVIALLYDNKGNSLRLRHPFATAGMAGTEALLRLLHDPKVSLNFVSGQVRVIAGQLTITPASVVYTREGDRAVLQPFIATSPERSVNVKPTALSRSSDPITQLLTDVQDLLGHLFLSGIVRCSESTTRRISALASDAAEIGLAHTSRTLFDLVDHLTLGNHLPNSDYKECARKVIEASVVVSVALSCCDGI